MDCRQCGTCCTAPDIAALDKPVGVRCRHLTDNARCAIYDSRPSVCRNYRPDELCLTIAAPSLEERTARYLQLFGMVVPSPSSENRFNTMVPSDHSP